MQDAYFRTTSEVRSELRVVDTKRGTFDIVVHDSVLNGEVTIAGEDATVEEVAEAVNTIAQAGDVDPDAVEHTLELLESIDE